MISYSNRKYKQISPFAESSLTNCKLIQISLDFLIHRHALFNFKFVVFQNFYRRYFIESVLLNLFLVLKEYKHVHMMKTYSMCFHIHYSPKKRKS